MLNGIPEGEIIRQSHKDEGILRPESEKLIHCVTIAVTPEINRVADLVGDRAKAERMIVLNCTRRVDQSKSYLRNYLVANIFSAIALSTFLQSDQPEKIGNLFYERRDSGGDTYYDILNIDSWTEKKSANIPAPTIDRLFLRSLVEKKHLINYTPDFNHNRSFSSQNESTTEVAKLVGDTLLEISDNVDIRTVIESVYGKESSVVRNWKDLSRLIAEVKNGTSS